MKFSRVADSPALTLALAMVTPVIFVWSRNWHMYTWASLALSFCVLLAAALAVFALGSFLNALYLRKAANLPVWARRLAGFLLCAVIVLILYFFLYVPLSDLPKIYRRYAVPLGGVILVTAIVFRAGFKPLNLFLALCLLLFSGTGAVDVFQYYNSARQNALTADSTSVALKIKPNIYLFWLESYHSLPIMREVYGIDTGPLSDFMRSRQFFSYDNVYSTGHHTLAAMSDLYTMTSQFAPERGRQDIGPEGRLAIGGSNANTVYRILKENGYHTTYLSMGQSYYFQHKGIYLDETDMRPDFSKLDQFGPLLDLNKRLRKNIPNKFTGSLFERIQLAVQEGMQRQQPFYLGFKSGALHTPSFEAYTWKEKEAWVSGGEYQEAVRESSRELAEIVDYIIAEDPKSVIVLLGDHGSWRLRGIMDGVKNLSALEARLQEDGESLDSLADDIFGVLMAIRMPDGARDISYGYPMSHVNLFRHIFTALSEDTKILEDRQPSESVLSGCVIVKEGVVQHTSAAQAAAP